jgi:2'-5' RNA ligase
MRLFIAVDLGHGVREAVARKLDELHGLAPRARWLKPDALHVTLSFLGEVAEERLAPLRTLVTEVAARHPAFTLGAAGGGAFGSPKRPKVLWVGLSGELERLKALQAELAQALAGWGHPPEERAFSPHLTLARAKDPRGEATLAGCVRALEGASFGEGRIDKLILFHSQLSPKGAVHTPLVEAPLGG